LGLHFQVEGFIGYTPASIPRQAAWIISNNQNASDGRRVTSNTLASGFCVLLNT
jgi:hypothetical protein